MIPKTVKHRVYFKTDLIINQGYAGKRDYSTKVDTQLSFLKKTDLRPYLLVEYEEKESREYGKLKRKNPKQRVAIVG